MQVGHETIIASSGHHIFLLYRVMVRPTLEIGIDVGQRINLGDGKFSKKDKLIT